MKLTTEELQKRGGQITCYSELNTGSRAAYVLTNSVGRKIGSFHFFDEGGEWLVVIQSFLEHENAENETKRDIVRILAGGPKRATKVDFSRKFNFWTSTASGVTLYIYCPRVEGHEFLKWEDSQQRTFYKGWTIPLPVVATDKKLRPDHKDRALGDKCETFYVEASGFTVLTYSRTEKTSLGGRCETLAKKINDVLGRTESSSAQISGRDVEKLLKQFNIAEIREVI